MSNLIPPLLSSSPPPIVGPLEEDDDDDEFGDFRAAADSYNCDDSSVPPSPQGSPEKELKTDCSVNLDINCNKNQTATSTTEMPSVNFTDFPQVDLDRRKSFEANDLAKCEIQVNSNSSDSILLQLNVSDINEDNLSLAPEVEVQEMRKNVEQDSENDKNTKENSVPTNDLEESPYNGEQNSIEIDNVQSNLNSSSTEENLFDVFIESIQEKTSNSDDLSETNEIKSDNDYIEQFSDKIIHTDSRQADKCDTSTAENDFREPSPTGLDSKQSDDEFGDFANFENTFDKPFVIFEEKSDKSYQSETIVEADDDFGDFESSEFGDFSSHSEKPTFLSIDEKNAADKSETILKDIFPSTDAKMDEFQYADETKGNTVFHELKDVTETNALIYQWSKSHSQKLFFKALNIDTRNILYGPAWNLSMPRFAANLGLTPLEPVKTEILTPTPIQNASSPSNSSQKNGDIPTAQFDWNGSGLINPLDSMSTELPGTIPEDSSQTDVQPDFLPTTSEKVETSSNLFVKKPLKKSSSDATILRENETSDFSRSEQTDNLSLFQSPKLIPLRETHIYAEQNDLTKPGWLQPTILTPDLPRKETSVDQDDDDEFDDFQMVLPTEKKETYDSDVKIPNTIVMSQKLEHIFEPSLNSGPTSLPVKNDTNEDEFSDFHSSLPQPQILQPLQPVSVEPLKPIVQYSQPVGQINWPEPGVTDEYIKNIELSYSRKSEAKEENVKKRTEANVKKVSKENSLEDEEWTDFVSVSNPIRQIFPERTATPDLPLSVLNLNHVQAPKQPIPVITPSGLVQTKLSSLQPKSVVQTSVQPNFFKPQTTQFQPSIISSQYAANFPGTTAAAAADDDDEDWSDFVSSQPTTQTNGYQSKHSSNQVKAPQNNLVNTTTNIIMNPTHFETLQNYKAAPKPPRHVIPTISSVPELDFIAPKNRTSKK